MGYRQIGAVREMEQIVIRASLVPGSKMVASKEVRSEPQIIKPEMQRACQADGATDVR